MSVCLSFWEKTSTNPSNVPHLSDHRKCYAVKNGFLQTHKHTYMYRGLHNTYIRTYTYVRTYVHAYIRTCMHAYVRTYVHAYIHMYIHIHIHVLYMCLFL